MKHWTKVLMWLWVRPLPTIHLLCKAWSSWRKNKLQPLLFLKHSFLLPTMPKKTKLKVWEYLCHPIKSNTFINSFPHNMSVLDSNASIFLTPKQGKHLVSRLLSRVVLFRALTALTSPELQRTMVTIKKCTRAFNTEASQILSLRFPSMDHSQHKLVYDVHIHYGS